MTGRYASRLCAQAHHPCAPDVIPVLWSHLHAYVMHCSGMSGPVGADALCEAPREVVEDGGIWPICLTCDSIA